MQKSVLYQLFAGLDKSDRRAMKKYVRSVYFNKRQDVIDLYEYFNKKYEGKDSAFDKEVVFAAIYPNDKYDDKKMRYVMSFLLKNVEQYLLTKTKTADEIKNQMGLMTIYRNLNIEKGFLRAQANAEKLFEDSKIKGIDYYENSYKVELEKLNFKEGYQRLAPRNLQEVSDSLDLSYLAKKLKQSCLSLAHQNVYNIQYDTGLLELVLDYLEKQDWLKDNPAIALYFYFYRSETHENQDFYFKQLRLGLINDGHILPRDELKNLYLLAINYAIKRLNITETRDHFLLQAFQLYDSCLDKKILIENGYLGRFTFMNIAKIAFGLNKYDWIESFLADYSGLLRKKYRKQFVSSIQSLLHYHKKEYDKAMKLLHATEFDDLYLTLDSKALQLRIYYELNEFDVLSSFVISFQRFLERKKTLGYVRENYKNLIRFTRKMLESNLYDKEVRQKLLEEVKKTKALAESNWLKEMIQSSRG